MEYSFEAKLEIIGVNPFVFVPEDILNNLFIESKKEKGKIPVKGKLNSNPYTQTLLKFKGYWRLYVNTTMLKNSPKRIGEEIPISIEFDPEIREIKVPEKFTKALEKNNEAKLIFDHLSPSRKLEIVRYLSRLKSEDVLEKNILRAINFLLGKERFIGRSKP